MATYIITGSSGGIGKGVVKYLSELGHTCILVDVVPFGDDLDSRHYQFTGDMSDPDQLAEIFKKIGALNLKIDGLAHLVGITRDRTLTKMSIEEWDSVIKVNLRSTFLVLQAAAAIMSEHGGAIMLVGSTAAHWGNYGQLNYVATKGGIEAMTKTAARELARKGIRVNCIIPGLITTPMSMKIPEEMLKATIAQIPLGRPGTPEDIAKLAEFLLSDRSAYITGASIKIDGGLKM